MAARTKARKRALDVLFEADQRGLNAERLLDQRLGTPEDPAGRNPYTAELVRGVIAHWVQLNDALATYSQGWTIDRMPAVDRCALRLGAYEVLYRDDVPDAVAIAEAVALVKDLSTAESPAFVNGLLARISEIKATLV